VSRAKFPNLLLAADELLLALTVIVAGLRIQSPWFMFGSTPWLVLLATLFLWWRGPGWRAAGLRRPISSPKALMAGVVVGVGYQFVRTYAVEPVIARLTTGDLPNVSQFRSLIGNERQLAFWIMISWTLAAFLEEMAFRGWLMNRAAEIGRFTRAAWIVSALVISAGFGVLHAYQGLSGMIATGLTALVYAMLYLATGRNLWPCIVAHGVLDTTGFVMMYLGVYPGI
jgi:CAAX protease family protein